MNLDELRSVQSKERQTDSLQHLRESFYEDVSAYISDLEDQRDRAAEQADDPFADPEVRRLTDEIETASEVVEAIYDRRLGKLVKRASLAAADMPADADGLTAEEQALFEDLVDRIEQNKARVLDVLDADDGVVPAAAADEAAEESATDSRDGVAAEEAASVTDQEPPAPGDDAAPGDVVDQAPGDAPGDGTAEEPDSTPSGTDQAADEVTIGGGEGTEPAGAGAGDTRGEHGGTADHADDPQPDGGVADDASTGGRSDGAAASDLAGLDERTTVRITGDVDEFFGVDQREYDLEPEDVVTLPAANAEPLLEAGDAERLD